MMLIFVFFYRFFIVEFDFGYIKLRFVGEGLEVIRRIKLLIVVVFVS